MWMKTMTYSKEPVLAIIDFTNSKLFYLKIRICLFFILKVGLLEAFPRNHPQ